VLGRDFLDARNAQFVERDGYLAGDGFTLADLTMASMLSPLARHRSPGGDVTVSWRPHHHRRNIDVNNRGSVFRVHFTHAGLDAMDRS